MRSHESLRPWANVQFDDPEVLPHTVRLTKLHAALRPYLERVLLEAREGVPALRPDFWEALDYGESRDPYSYFFGSELYVCPVVAPKTEYRQVFLPEGEWVHLWSRRELTGGKEYRVRCRLGRIPVFYRKGSPFAEVFKAAAEA
jgi:alpha-glucosidase